MKKVANGAVSAWQESIDLADKIVVYSVPHTGSHFAVKFLEALGKDVMLVHAQDSSLTKVYQMEGAKVVVPVRHPHDVFRSHWQRADWARAVGWRAVMTKLLMHYSWLIQTIDLFDYVPLRVDCDPASRLATLLNVANHAGIGEFNVQSAPDGSLVAKDESTKIIMEWVNDWPRLAWLPHDKPVPSDVDYSRLDPIMEWVGYEIDPNYVGPINEGLPEHQTSQTPGGGLNINIPLIQASGKAVIRRIDGSTQELLISTKDPI